MKRRVTLSPDERLRRQNVTQTNQFIFRDDNKWVHMVHTFSFLNSKNGGGLHKTSQIKKYRSSE